MADYEATGDELQKLVLLGKKRPMPFAFCPSSGGDDESLFATHRKKPPEVIAKAARKAADTTKVCFGTYTVEGRLMTLVLIKELPSIAKRLKKHLNRERLYLNIKIVDVMGNDLEEDIDELAEDALADIDDDDTQDDADEADAVVPEAQDEPADDLPDAKELACQLKELQPGIMALQGDAGDKLRAALGGAVGLLKAGQLVRAESTIAAIARAFARQIAAAAAPVPPPPPDAAALSAAQRLTKLRAAVAQIGGPAGEKLTAALGLVAQQIPTEPAKAMKAMDAVEQAVARSKPIPEAGAPVSSTQCEDGAHSTAPKLEATTKWDALAARLEPMVLATVRAGKGDVDAIKRKFFSMQDQAAAGKHEAALAAAPALAEMIKAAKAATQTQAEAEIPADVVPFVKSRLGWINTRAQLRSELERLKAAMDQTLAGIEGMEDALSETGKLFTYLDALDTRLEKTLETLVKTPDGPERQALKAKAREIIAEYRAELDTGFFRDVDGDNGFVPVKIRGPAVAALQEVSAALAA